MISSFSLTSQATSWTLACLPDVEIPWSKIPPPRLTRLEVEMSHNKIPRPTHAVMSWYQEKFPAVRSRLWWRSGGQFDCVAKIAAENLAEFWASYLNFFSITFGQKFGRILSKIFGSNFGNAIELTSRRQFWSFLQFRRKVTATASFALASPLSLFQLRSNGIFASQIFFPSWKAGRCVGVDVDVGDLHIRGHGKDTLEISNKLYVCSKGNLSYKRICLTNDSIFTLNGLN